MRDGLVSRRLRARASALVMFMFIAALGGLAATVAPAGAATFSNSTAITMPDPDCTDPDVASPYPSNISVSGLTGTITDVNVTLTGVTHPFQGDIELLLVGPTGANLVVLSDAGTGSLSNATVTFDDAAASAPPQNSAWGPGTYKPVNYLELSGPDAFPAPAPAASANTTLAGAFNGTAPNGSWSLYVIDDACPDGGSIAGGWSLDITTASAAATTTSVTSSLNPSRTGQSVTFTATVQSGGSPVTAGTVTFSEGATVLAANVAVNAAGQATFSTSALAEGNHVVTATYNGTGEFATSAGTVNQRVDNNTTVTGTTYCNTGPITINDNGPATPYPSNVFVTGFAGTVGSVTVALKNVTHAFAGDVEALLVGPGGQNLVLVSDAGTAGVSNVTVNFDDAAAGPLPQAGSWAPANATVSADPTNYAELTGDVFPAPAPTVSAATTLATFNGSDPNGTWSLFVIDDAAPDGGSVAGGWCLTFTAAKATPTIATQASAGGPVGTSVTDTATVSGGAAPTGTVTFNLYGPNDATCAGAPVFTSTVALAGSTATSGSFAPTVPGTYRWTAVYNGDANNDPATSPCNAPNESVVITKAAPTIATQASPGGPPGTALTDTATVSGGFNPTGSVVFNLYGPNDATCAGAPVFTSTVALAGSTATSGSFAPTVPGTYRWTAVYNGDANNDPATSPCNAPNESATIGLASPTISTQASPGGPIGTAVTDTATVSGGFSPTGTVTFRLFADSGCSSQVFTSTNALSGSTATSGSFTPTAPGTYYWTAVYNGDASNNQATSPCQAPNESVTITKASPTISTQASPGGLLGAPVRDVATLAGGQNPAGTVTFRLFSDGACTSEVFTSTNALAGTTATSDWFTPTAPGTYFWTAVYGGDANNNPATSPCQAPNESVTITPFAPPAPTRTLTGDVLGPVTVNAGESVLVTDARVVGPVVVNPGGALTIVDSRITQGVTVDAPSFLSICGSQIAGPPGGQALGVSNAAVPIRIGDPASGCAGNRLAGDVNLTGNLAVTFGANIVSRHVSVNSNGPGATVIKANNIFGMLSCAANNPAPTNAGQVNTAGSKSGQCAAL
jgi:subtilisin-like proprotein convertase family protein